ncbi:hypothetical protein M422DRAFT_241547 [Sphaerobolus stellatus SS14]|nr:hypothetical protein M422DRAFT_241547 [Sphaerobolus stellatus SS14]
MLATSPRVLFIDSYDSFTHNLAHLLRRTIPSCQIHLIHNNTLTLAQLRPFLSCFHAIVIGPGPGHPANPADVGLIPDLWKLKEDDLLPIFGVCLGFQSLGLACGGRVRRMKVVKHGMISRVEHEGFDLFEGVGEGAVEATRYHSLCVDLPDGEEMIPLAWADDKHENGRVLMGGRHKTKPFWGVQYHPESVCSSRGGGEDVIRNFWRLACEWSNERQRMVQGLPLPPWMPEVLRRTWPQTRALNPPDSKAHSETTSKGNVSYVAVNYPAMPIPQVCEALGVALLPDSSDFVLLDSAATTSGRFSIIGSLRPDKTLSVRYTLPEAYITLRSGYGRDSSIEKAVLPGETSIWAWLAAFMRERAVGGGCADVPFWGGFVGYLSYEAGVVGLDVPLKHREAGATRTRHPDVNLVFVERSVVYDAERGVAYVQSILPGDEEWIQDVSRRLEGLRDEKHATEAEAPRRTFTSHLTSPPQEVYVPRVEECKEHLAVGSSYELCLTAQSTLRISMPGRTTSWDLYKQLRSSNPAPHAAYLRLGPTTVLCSSPERFLKWDRHGRCELRPIKGTLRKVVVDEEGKKRVMRREDAEELLGRNVKERAENLMIVDLVRHDLGGVIDAPDGVSVERLMVIEEYETVWQMVSVISGSVRADGGGWEVLRRSLPPGSMTGAPKKRSVEILQDIEGEERGIYSGVLGYWCVGGGGDWAVVIRTCFRYDDGTHLNGEGMREEEWRLGAGGAITALSESVGEWEEMGVKLSSVGRGFGVECL